MISLSKFNLKPQARDLSPAWVLCIIGIIPYKAPLKGLAGVAIHRMAYSCLMQS